MSIGLYCNGVVPPASECMHSSKTKRSHKLGSPWSHVGAICFLATIQALVGWQSLPGAGPTPRCLRQGPSLWGCWGSESVPGYLPQQHIPPHFCSCSSHAGSRERVSLVTSLSPSISQRLTLLLSPKSFLLSHFLPDSPNHFQLKSRDQLTIMKLSK